MSTLTRWLKRATICVGAGLCSLLVLPHAYAANNCNSLDKNESWKSAFSLMNDAYKAGDFKSALEHSKKLEGICDESPILNYTIAQIHKSLGDNVKYVFYLQKSTQNTERFAVDKNMLEKMWNENYIATHPEADPENIAKREARLESLAAEIAELKEELRSVKQNAGSTQALHETVSSAQAADDAWLWTSVGIAAAGLALTGVGTYFVAANHDKSVDSDAKGFYTKKGYTLGWAMLGAGIGMTVVGVVSTGFFGYRYHMNHSSDESTDLSFTISPTYTSLSFTF